MGRISSSSVLAVGSWTEGREGGVGGCLMVLESCNLF